MLRRKRHSTQKGYSVVEFTLTLPFLLLMFGIMADFGRMYMQYTSLTKAVQSGARWAIYGSDDGKTIADETEIKNIVVYGATNSEASALLSGFTTSDVVVDNSGSDYVYVEASYQYSPLINISFLTDNLNLTLTASSIMRK